MSMTVCPRCGSVGTRGIKGGPFQRLVAAVRRQAVIYCARCGWRGRQAPLAETPAFERRTALPVEPPAPSPDLASLDGQLAAVRGERWER